MTEQDFQQQMLSFQNQASRFQEQILNRFDSRQRDVDSLRQNVDGLKYEVEGIKQDIMGIRTDLATEVQRWDERFFKFSRDTANRANTLIASAVIAATLLTILKN